MARSKTLVFHKLGFYLNPSSYGVFLGFSLLLSFLGIYVTRHYLMDDALITLRYSYNFARFGIPIWNQADLDHPSMGYTSLLWMVINAVPALFTSNKDMLVLLAKLFSAIPLAGIVVLLAREIYSLRISAPLRFLAGFVVFSQFGYGFHVNSAMETMLFSFLVLLAVRAYSREEFRPAYVYGMLSFLVRPEGALLVALLCVWDLRKRRFAQAVIGGAVFSFVIAGTALLLYSWYGDILPNPFYAKQEILNVEALTRTVFFIATLALPFLVMAFYVTFFQGNKAASYFLVSALVYVIYYSTVDPIMNVMSRYQWSSLLLLTYAGIPAFALLGTSSKRSQMAAAGFLLLLLAMNGSNALGASYFADADGHAMRNIITLGKAMAKHRDPGKWLVYHDAGAVCYFSDWNTYEIIGLTNRAIAKGEIRPVDLYKNPNAQIILRNFDLMAEGQEQAKREYSDWLSEYGYVHVRDLPVLSVPGQRDFVIAVYARDVQLAKAILQDTKIAAPLQPSLSYMFYRTVRKIVKGQ